MLSHQAARGAIIMAFRELFGRDPKRIEAQFAQAVALYESGYGSYRFFNHETGEYVTDTKNWGSVHCGQMPPCPPDCFEATDTHADGTKYLACFKRFSSAGDGARFFVRTFYKQRPALLAAANSASIENVAEAIHATHYSEASPQKLVGALTTSLVKITQALNEPMPKATGGSIRWRLILGISALAIVGYYVWPLVSGRERSTESKSEE
jgi:hypothetical protein